MVLCHQPVAVVVLVWFGLVLVLDDKNKERWKDGDDEVGR